MARCDDGFDPNNTARELLTDALRLGGRATSTSDHAGAYALLACAMKLVRKLRGLDEGTDFRLDRALTKAESEETDEDKADALREAIERFLGHGDPEDDDPPAPLAGAKLLISRAISIGAPAYNAGDQRGCYDVYSCTARAILATITSLQEPAAERLRAALAECLEMDEPDAQAWAMRHGFDAVLEMSALSSGVPHQVRELISVAISIGAPVFNTGDHLGCYETYAATSRLLVNSTDTPEAVKDVLRTALDAADRNRNPTRQAWIMREAFDELLGAEVA